MTSEYHRFKASLLRRFKLIRDFPDARLRAKYRKKIDGSFALQFLAYAIDPTEAQPFEIGLTHAALQIAFQEGVAEAVELVNAFATDKQVSIAMRVISEPEAQSIGKLNHYCDSYLFGSPIVFEDVGRSKRNCYEEILSNFEINLPLTKRSIHEITKAINPSFCRAEVSSFSDLSQLVAGFVRAAWPLFERSVLDIPAIYFDFDQRITAKQIEEHLEKLTPYGLERLLARIIVLRAVCDDVAATDVLDRAIPLCGYPAADTEVIVRYVRERRGSFSGDAFVSSPSDGVLLRSIKLLIFLRSSESAYSFLKRLVEVYQIDKSVLCLVNWYVHLDLIEEAGDLLVPELVALAAIFSETSILKRSKQLKNLYIPTAAGTDLLKYARYCREQQRMSAYNLFKSFSRLPDIVRDRVFFYIISPGTIDVIAGIFPPSRPLLKGGMLSDAVNPLTFKLDCIIYLKRNGLLRSPALSAIEDETRQRLRQVRYETELGSGRIRVTQPKLSQSIRRYVEEALEVAFAGTPTFPIDDTDLQSFLRERGKQIFCERLARYICFESRVSFDYLMSHLRHNLLRFKLESTIDRVFHSHRDIRTEQLKVLIESELDVYCRMWLTISPNRSFFSGLVGDFYEYLSSRKDAESQDLNMLGAGFAGLALSRFKALLADCRVAWRTQFKADLSSSLDAQLVLMGLDSDSALKARLASALDAAFSECENWLNINDSPISRRFGIKDLFQFESINFSSAKTRIQPFTVSCYDARERGRTPHLTGRDIVLPGRYFDAVVQLVHNLLENAYDHSGLPIANTFIDVAIYELWGGRIRVEFRNNFESHSKDLMQQRVTEFNNKIDEIKHKPANAPAKTGGSGLNRILFEFSNLPRTRFYIRASNSHFSKFQFLVICEFKIEEQEDGVNGKRYTSGR